MKNNFEIIQFAAALIIIFVIELAVGIAAAVYKQDFSTAMKDTLKESMKNYTNADQQAWDNVQKKVSIPNLERGTLMGSSIQKRGDEIDIVFMP